MHDDHQGGQESSKRFFRLSCTMITKEVKNHQRYFLDYHLIMIRSTSRWFTLVSTLDEAIGCKFVLIQISISLLLLKFKDEKTIEILKSVLKRFGNRSTTNCRIRWSDATKAGFYSGGRSSWWLPGFFDLLLFSFSGHNVFPSLMVFHLSPVKVFQLRHGPTPVWV